MILVFLALLAASGFKKKWKEHSQYPSQLPLIPGSTQNAWDLTSSTKATGCRLSSTVGGAIGLTTVRGQPVKSCCARHSS